MRNRILKPILLVAPTLLCLCFALVSLASDKTSTPSTPQSFPAFEIGAVELAAEPHAQTKKSPALTVVCFLGTQCPLAKLYAVRLNELAQTFSKQDVRFVGVASNFQDSEDDIEKFAVEQKLGFPIVKDFDQRIADAVGVKRTPEVFVVTNDDLTIHYRGRVDDQYSPGVVRSGPQREDLKLALEQLLAGDSVDVASTAPEGCLLGRGKRKLDPHPTVTWTGQISAWVKKNCAQCHQPGDIGPFSVADYNEVVGWSDMMMETIDQKRMPPWHADPHVGKFINERRLTKAEIDLFRTWIDQGTPHGEVVAVDSQTDATDSSAQQISEWRLPKEPDLVVPMADQPFAVAADGIIEYQYFVVDPGFETDRWISAAEIRPGNRAVVHHSIVFVRPPDGTTPAGVGWLAAYVPGQRPLAFDPSRARFVPAGSKFVFQQHYTTIGAEAEDLTSVGIVFADPDEVKTELLTLMAIDQNFEIEPHEKSHRVTARLDNFDKDAQLISIAPHMHFRGKSFKAFTHRTDDEQPAAGELVLSVPRYDFNWQHAYQFAQPIALNGVEEISIDVEFDNSADNPFNPDPAAWVMWGDQTFEEMAVAFFDVQRPRQPAAAEPDEGTVAAAAKDRSSPVKSENTENSKNTETSKGIETLTESQRDRLDNFVDRYFNRFDANGDGAVTSDELPLIKQYEPNAFDVNEDQRLSRDELAAGVWGRFQDK